MTKALPGVKTFCTCPCATLTSSTSSGSNRAKKDLKLPLPFPPSDTHDVPPLCIALVVWRKEWDERELQKRPEWDESAS